MKIFFYNLSLIYQGRQRFCQKATKLLKDINIKNKKEIFYFYFSVLQRIQNSKAEKLKIHISIGIRNLFFLIKFGNFQSSDN